MTETTPEAQPAPETPVRFEFSASRQFTAWLFEQRVSLAFTTYQAGKLFLLGLKPDGRLEIFNRTFARCMGLCATPETLWMSSLYQLWRFENSLAPGQSHQGYDRLYVPQIAYTTGDLDIHDIALDPAGQPLIVNTLFSCLATVSERHSFKPLWQPNFITKLAAEDRCHLNGLAVQDGEARYVTCVGRSDVADGWREHRQGGGLLIEVKTQEIILTGLSMPHSPRLHRAKLWLLDSGQGQFGYVDLARGVFESVTFCPGYGRGLAFAGDFAVVGLSRPRHDGSFSGLPLDGALAAKGAEARCGLLVIDLRTGDAVHWLRLSGAIDELYDVALLPGIRRPMAVGLQTDEIRRVISVAP
ncbi:MAG: TIGR03032 family protein [Chloroflexi bacterium]|nr:TIGR03032 family protein [Chloroflexota bacterium]